MRRSCALSMLLGMVAASPALADGIAFQYTIEREHAGNVIETSFLRGFEIQDGLRLRVKLNQASFCYVIMSHPSGGFRLVFPDPETRKTDAIGIDQWARIPKSTFVRMGEDPGVGRMYIIVASQRIPELEQATARRAVVSEALAFEVRDRYLGDGSYSRDLEGPTVTVKYRPRNAGPVVVVEEIAVQAIRAARRAASATTSR